MTRIKRLVGEIRGWAWSWTLESGHSLALALHGRLREECAGRRTYEMPEGVTMSLYHDENCVQFIEFTLDVIANLHLLSPADYEDTKDKFFQKFEDAVAEAATVLGPPVFSDGAAASEFPADQDAEWLALWNLTGGRIMLEQKHEDKELPLRLSFVLAPRVHFALSH